MNSIRKKLVALFAGVLSVALGALAFTLIAGERAQITRDITENAVHFAELSGERIAALHDLYYVSESFAIFDSELAGILDRNPAVTRVQMLSATGELLFDSGLAPEDVAASVIDDSMLERLEINKLSLKTAERVVYLSRDMHAAARATEDAESNAVTAIADSEQVSTVLYPLADEKRRVAFHLSYSAVQDRVLQSVGYLAALFLFGFVGSLLIATWFSRQLTAPLTALRIGAQRIAKGELDTKIVVDTHDETKVLADTFNQMATDLSGALDQKIELKRAEKEFEVASEIQTSTLPSDVSIDGLDVAVHFTPASEVGGDVYDVIRVDDDRTLFYLGDVTGHGVAAGIVAALTNAIFATATATTDSIPAIIKEANRVIHKKTQPAMFVTMLTCEWNAKKNLLQYANAGHEPGLIFRAKTGTIESLESGGIGLGMLPVFQPEPVLRSMQLESGDFFMIFTDGIVEARNEAGDMLMMSGVEKMYAETCLEHDTAEDVRAALFAKFQAYHGTCTPDDDVTFFVIRVM